MSMKLFRNLLLSLRKDRAKGYQFAPLRMIFDVKVELRRKYRLVIGVHAIDYSGHKVYSLYKHHEVRLRQDTYDDHRRK